MSPQFNDTTLVKSCPVCLRVMWANSVCHHGQPPTDTANAPKEDEVVKEKKGFISKHFGKGKK